MPRIEALPTDENVTRFRSREDRIQEAVSKLLTIYDLVKSGQVDTQGMSHDPKTGELITRLNGLVLPRQLKLAIDSDGDPTGAFRVTKPRLELITPNDARRKAGHTEIKVDPAGTIGVGVNACRMNPYDYEMMFRPTWAFVSPETVSGGEYEMASELKKHDLYLGHNESPRHHAQQAFQNIINAASQASTEIAKHI